MKEANGEKEMDVAFHPAGFEPWDFTMSYLLKEVISLQEFYGIVFVGGFCYAGQLDSAIAVVESNLKPWVQQPSFDTISEVAQSALSNNSYNIVKFEKTAIV
ncbi:putative phosphoribosylformylglycinamidine synthase [Medicago truncatula]|uniref:CobB/CobQ-like glutamine amidotransferase domain protein n=1 Tax=Medicago truncatula TaxID=3880 RepID=G7KGT4_MEDTR|nr:CobB/CobQ-like glutamine amidotransferase domain protein [Medicago truncatula]RHN57004.1 putative phosphoribosylformylglycinamidine synthase [Medicago truncatula]